VPERSPQELESGELFLTERVFRTYRRDRWKSMWNRVDGIGHLFDLAEDPGETRDVAADHPEELDAHRRRIDELSRSIAAAPREARNLAPEDRQRLRALGYLE